MNRRKFLAAIGIVAVAISLAGASPAEAGGQRACVPAAKQTGAARDRAVKTMVTKMSREGADAGQIVADVYRNFCVSNQAQAAPGAVTPMSTGAVVTVSTPVWFRESSGAWLIWSQYYWNNLNPAFSDDIPWSCLKTCNIGGNDAFGVVLSARGVVTDSYMEGGGLIGGPFYKGANIGSFWVSTANQYGVAYQFQDKMTKYGSAGCGNVWPDDPDHAASCASSKVCFNGGNPPPGYCVDYFGARGMSWVEVSQLECGFPVQAVAGYAHTWSETSISGIGVGPMQFSVSWSSAGNGWSVASANSPPTNC